MHACTSLVLQASFRSVGCMHATHTRQSREVEPTPDPGHRERCGLVQCAVGVGEGVRDAHRDQETEAWKNVGLFLETKAVSICIVIRIILRYSQILQCYIQSKIVQCYRHKYAKSDTIRSGAEPGGPWPLARP